MVPLSTGAEKALRRTGAVPGRGRIIGEGRATAGPASTRQAQIRELLRQRAPPASRPGRRLHASATSPRSCARQEQASRVMTLLLAAIARSRWWSAASAS